LGVTELAWAPPSREVSRWLGPAALPGNCKNHRYRLRGLPRIAPAASLCRQRGLGALGCQPPLLLGQSGIEVQHERVGVLAQLSDHEWHSLGHQAGHKGTSFYMYPRRATSSTVNLLFACPSPERTECVPRMGMFAKEQVGRIKPAGAERCGLSDACYPRCLPGVVVSPKRRIVPS